MLLHVSLVFALQYGNKMPEIINSRKCLFWPTVSEVSVLGWVAPLRLGSCEAVHDGDGGIAW